jgi:putative oxidoreductase
MANQSGTPVGQDVILLLGRLALGAIFVKSGLQKLMALGAFAASLAGRGVPQSSVWAVIGATVEVVGGLRLQESQFFKNLAIIGGFLLLAVTGSGRFSLDALLRRRKS